MEMICIDQYNLKEIREAFKLTIHDKGELWFGGETNDWAYEWKDFQDNLRKATNTPGEWYLCTLCNNATRNIDSVCDDCEIKNKL